MNGEAVPNSEEFTRPVAVTTPLVRRRGASLPHWRRDGATYAVTFRLADSLPQEVLLRWKREREDVVRRAESMGRSLTEHENRRLDELHSDRVEKWLDSGHGCCALPDPRIATLVRDAMKFFDGERYELAAWCAMPNHAHAVVRTVPGYDISKIVQSWKGFTGKKAWENLGRVGSGAFWQHEPYDHLVRDWADLRRCVRYVLQNPEKAGLKDWPWVGGRVSAARG